MSDTKVPKFYTFRFMLMCLVAGLLNTFPASGLVPSAFSSNQTSFCSQNTTSIHPRFLSFAVRLIAQCPPSPQCGYDQVNDIPAQATDFIGSYPVDDFDSTPRDWSLGCRDSDKEIAYWARGKCNVGEICYHGHSSERDTALCISGTLSLLLPTSPSWERHKTIRPRDSGSLYNYVEIALALLGDSPLSPYYKARFIRVEPRDRDGKALATPLVTYSTTRVRMAFTATRDAQLHLIVGMKSPTDRAVVNVYYSYRQ